MAKRIDGKAFAKGLRERVGAAVSSLQRDHGLTPGLAVVLVGEDPASQVYVRNKGKQTLEAGMKSFEHKLPDTTSETELLGLIDQLNADPDVHGILVQLPLPDQIDSHAVINAINPDKDVDGFHLINVGRLSTGASGLVPCTPLGCLMLLKDELGDLSGKNAVVVGRSNIVGKPMAALLLAESCTVTIAHSRTQDLAGVCREADILVAAVGRPEMIPGDWVKPGAVVVDIGINAVPLQEKNAYSLPGRAAFSVVGDVHAEDVSHVAGAMTCVPGGAGPMTIAALLSNTFLGASRRDRQAL